MKLDFSPPKEKRAVAPFEWAKPTELGNARLETVRIMLKAYNALIESPNEKESILGIDRFYDLAPEIGMIAKVVSDKLKSESPDVAMAAKRSIQRLKEFMV